jgi:hypothetical protein
VIPSWWRLTLWSRPARPAEEVFREVRVSGGRAVTFRRLFRIGPFSFCLVRYGRDGT